MRVALAQGTRLQDVRWSRSDRTTLVGNLYLGVVRKVEPGLDAAFVHFGGARAGFLHVGNLHPGYALPGADPFEVAAMPAAAAEKLADVARERKAAPVLQPPASIAGMLSPGRRVLVQVLRDPVRGKGATLTTFVSLAGRLLVLMPSLGRVGVSRRIQDEKERARLRAALQACEVPEGLGLIARTAAAGSRRRHLRQDLRHLLKQWDEVGRAVRKDPDLCLVHREPSPAVRAVRDLFLPKLERIVVDDEKTAGEVEDFLSSYVPRARVPVERYARTRPLFEAYDLERDYQLLFRPRVPLDSGASIVVHETEALTAIDVNSGRIDQGSLEQTALHANLLAAREIARQIRLRDLGGILVVDFIDMAQPSHRREVEAAFREALQEDRSRGKPGRLGAFGLMALTRRRLGNGLPRAAESPCPACAGTGSLSLLRAGALRALRRLRALGGDGGRWRLRAHPGVLGILEEEFQEEVSALDFELEPIGDSQVPAGEPVLERV